MAGLEVARLHDLLWQCAASWYLSCRLLGCFWKYIFIGGCPAFRKYKQTDSCSSMVNIYVCFFNRENTASLNVCVYVCVFIIVRENYTGYVRYVCQRKSDTHSPTHTHSSMCQIHRHFKTSYMCSELLKSEGSHFCFVRWQNFKWNMMNISRHYEDKPVLLLLPKIKK